MQSRYNQGYRENIKYQIFKKHKNVKKTKG